MSPENFTNADNSIFSEIFRDVTLQNSVPLVVIFAFHGFSYMWST